MPHPERIYLDARGLEHPIPLERAIAALRQLEEGNYFHMVHRKNPVPLIDMANEQGFAILSRQDSDGTWHILISADPSVALEALCDV